MDAFTKRISSKIAPVLGSEPSAMFKQSSSSIMRRSMTMREIELRRHLSSNVADDDNPDADLVRTEAESTRHAHPGAARGDAWTANLERAAEHLVDSIHLPTPRAVSMEERTAMAACFVRHAITRTPLTEGINWQSPVARAVHRWRQHTAYEWTRRLALLALLLLVLWEPPVTGGGATASAGWAACSVVEIVCSVAFLGDLVLMLLCTSPRHFFRSPSSCAFGLIVITISLDALVCAFYVGVQQPLLRPGAAAFHCVRCSTPEAAWHQIAMSGVSCSHENHMAVASVVYHCLLQLKHLVETYYTTSRSVKHGRC